MDAFYLSDAACSMLRGECECVTETAVTSTPCHAPLGPVPQDGLAALFEPRSVTLRFSENTNDCDGKERHRLDR